MSYEFDLQDDTAYGPSLTFASVCGMQAIHVTDRGV